MLRDDDRDFARSYSTAGTSTFVVRPDGHLGYAAHGADVDDLLAHLGNTFR